MIIFQPVKLQLVTYRDKFTNDIMIYSVILYSQETTSKGVSMYSNSSYQVVSGMLACLSDQISNDRPVEILADAVRTI